MSVPLTVTGNLVDNSGAAPVTGDLIPAGVRSRQLSIRTLLTGMMLTLADGPSA